MDNITTVKFGRIPSHDILLCLILCHDRPWRGAQPLVLFGSVGVEDFVVIRDKQQR